MTTKNEARAAEVIAQANLARRERHPHAEVPIVTQQAAREYAAAHPNSVTAAQAAADRWKENTDD